MAPRPIQHKARIYTGFPGSSYVLPSDEPERERCYINLEWGLALQHRILRRVYDGKLLLAPVSLQDNSLVLETGSGSAVWLLDFAKELPSSVKLEGIDIEARLFPVDPPDNITLSTCSVTDLPSQWTNRFALLCEAGERIAGPITVRHSRFVEKLCASRGLFTRCAHHMPRMLAEAGFTNVHVEKRSVPVGRWAGPEGADLRDNLLGVWKGQKTPFLNAGGFGYVHSEAEFDRRIEDVRKEWDETPGAHADIFIFYAQKVR
ncbi:hypothetical protein BDQ12DRAFT_701345 [Crucibulum laeve]|uniref:S-adenosyl-L-methionine-dependent methyltransferase n=1 Tax=Crucibulum laeve TaxID=68775 RepID=A0A5C3LFW5_9AGAR|nr:hypothetical protein BDQ12DRAFT_701345 [Crucibulum laeve]